MQKKRWIVLIIFFIGILLHSQAQQIHFAFIQADDKQPFSVKLNNKLYNSSPSGYVIIPKLIDGKYEATVDFPGNKYPEQQFFILLDKKDVGYSLKNFDEKGWGLFNLQTFALTMNGQDIAGTDVAVKQEDITTNGNQASAFGNMLSQVTNDSTLTKIVEPAEEIKKPIEEPAKIIDTAAIKPDATLNVQDIISANNAIVNNVVSTDSTQAIFIEQKTQAVDSAQTINTAGTIAENTTQMLPIAKDTALDNTTREIYNNNDVVADTSSAKKELDNPFFKKEEPVADANANTGIIKNEPTVTDSDQTANSGLKPAYKQDCRSMIKENDIEKMKRKMVLQDNNDGMIQVAKKYLTDKCITEQQVKAISGLFLTDEGRYLLFDALYSYVYDYGNYPLLEKQLVDDYYKTRFKAMLY